MHTARSRRRALALVLTAGALVSLSACGSGGVMTNGSTAATHGSHTVSTEAVQQAVTDINAADPQGSITGQQAAVFLALEPEITKLAARYGATTTPSEVEQEFGARMPKGQSMDPAAVDTIRASVQLNKLVSGENKSASAKAQNLIKKADIDLNPRYGEFSKGSIRNAATNWIDPAASKAQQ